MDALDSFIFFIFSIKIIYLFLVLYVIYLKRTKSKNTQLITKLEKYEKITEFLVITCLGILLMVLFVPNKPQVVIKGETQDLLFLLGFVLLVTLKNYYVHITI